MDDHLIVKRKPHMDLQSYAAARKRTATEKRKQAERLEKEAAGCRREAEELDKEATEYLSAAVTLAKALGLPFVPMKEG